MVENKFGSGDLLNLQIDILVVKGPFSLSTLEKHYSQGPNISHVGTVVLTRNYLRSHVVESATGVVADRVTRVQD